MSTTFRARLRGGSRLAVGSRLALVCGIAIAVAAPAIASGSQAAGGQDAVGAVYTQTNSPAGNAVVVFDRASDGTLTKRESVSTGGTGSTQSVGCGPGCPILDSQTAVVVSKNGKFVFAVNAGSDTVTSFRETKDGLVRVDQVSSGGDMPESLALHGDLLYVLNVATGGRGNIYGLRISPDGGLSPIGSSRPLADPAPPDHSADPRAIDFNSKGTVLVVTEIAGGFMGPGGPPGRIVTFVVGNDGKAGPAASHPSNGGFPFGFAFDNKDHLIVTNIEDPSGMSIGSVSSYTVSDSGDVTPINKVSSGGVLPCWVVVTNDGRTAYVVNTGAGLPAPVTFYDVSSKGVLSSGGAPAASSPGEFARTDAALSRDDKYLYVLSPSVGPGAPSHIDEYRLANDGSMTLIGSTPAGADLGVGATGLAAR